MMARDLLPVTPIRCIFPAPVIPAGPMTAGVIRDEHGAFLFDQDRQYIGSEADAVASARG
ncbi:MAG: hypothetical protein ABFD97_14440 [Syntrophobacter sp.]